MHNICNNWHYYRSNDAIDKCFLLFGYHIYMTTQFSPQEYAEETKQENIGFLRTGKNSYFFLHLGHIKFRSWVRFPMRSLDFSVDLILPDALWPGVD
jgi:hypothetical protein